MVQAAGDQGMAQRSLVVARNRMDMTQLGSNSRFWAFLDKWPQDGVFVCLLIILIKEAIAWLHTVTFLKVLLGS